MAKIIIYSVFAKLSTIVFYALECRWDGVRPHHHFQREAAARHSVACGGVPCAGWVIAGRGGCHAALWPFCGSHAIRSGFRVDGSGIVSEGFLINALFVSSVALLMKACLFCIHATALRGNCHIISPNPCFADAFLHYSIFHLLSCLIPFPFFDV